ncbi:MAG: TIGR03986 family CRISPR-associated RAMP protein [Hungatella sp.]|nr:TIGR03986 family CRISPR-associated RAMP protein [Hungatella sp.]
MSNWEETQKRFINPYNFIPLEGKVTRDTFECRDFVPLTGYFDCSLELLTPMIIPNTSNSKALHTKKELEGEKYTQTSSFNFFSYEDLSTYKGDIAKAFEPVIPGSEIRGAVRSVYEAAFNGCMSAVSEKRRMGRRSSKPKKPGILEYKDNRWVLYPCERWMLYVDGINIKPRNGNEARFGIKIEKKVYDSWIEGKRIFVRRDSYIKTKSHKKNEVPLVDGWRLPGDGEECPNNWKEGFLHKGEPFINKHYESIFVRIQGEKKIPVSSADIEALKWAIEEYRDSKKNLNKKDKHSGYSHYKIDNQMKILVYYQEEINSPLYLSPACIGKEISGLTVGELLKESGEYQPCEDIHRICPSCSLFGMVSGKPGTKGALASKVRFTDALVNEKREKGKEQDYYLSTVVLPELGEPKPGAAEFYTKIPPKITGWKFSKGYWTYDYYCNKDTRSKWKPIRVNYFPELRGRKYYWHHEGWNEVVNDRKEMNEMRQRVRPLKAGSENLFYFRIYFENISEQELSQLKWALDFDWESCAHKIGRGKPLGFGSTRIHINNIYCREIKEGTGLWKLEKREPALLGKEVKISKKVEETLLAMADWNNHPSSELVRYPLADNNGNNKNSNSSHQWFNGNKNKSPESSNMEPVFSKVLPDALEEVGDDKTPWLFELKKKI